MLTPSAWVVGVVLGIAAKAPELALWARDGQVLGQHVLDDVSVHVGQAEVATLESVREALVVDAEQVQDRRLKVVDVHGGLR